MTSSSRLPCSETGGGCGCHSSRKESKKEEKMKWMTVDWEGEVEFCPDDSGCPSIGEISTRIGLDLFCSANLEAILKARYEQMKRNFRDVPYVNYGCPQCDASTLKYLRNMTNPNKPDARLGVDSEIINSGVPEIQGLFSQPKLGHDLPVWLRISSPQKQVKKIMIISEDPKREDGERGELSLSTPFGIHCATYRNRTRNDLAFRMVEHLLASYGIVYITDARKLYAGEDGRYIKTRVKKDGYFRYWFDHILDDVELIKPDLIVTLGNDVVDATYTNSVLSNAHFPKDGIEVQTVSKVGGHPNYSVISAYHPAMVPCRIKSKSGKILPAGKHLASLSECTGTGQEIKEAYFEKILKAIDEHFHDENQQVVHSI